MSGYDDDLGYDLADGSEVPCSPVSGFPTFTEYRKLKCELFRRPPGHPEKTGMIRIS